MSKTSKTDAHYHRALKKAGNSGVIKNSGILSNSGTGQKMDGTSKGTPSKGRHGSLLRYAIAPKTKD